MIVDDDEAIGARAVAGSTNNAVVIIGSGSGELKSTNVWRHLKDHGIFSSTGQARKNNAEKFRRAARLAAGSELRASDPQRYFALQLTEALFINKAAPFAWAEDPKLRLFFKGLNDYLRLVLPPELGALVEEFPGFNVELFHNQTVKVRTGWLTCCLTCVCWGTRGRAWRLCG